MQYTTLLSLQGTQLLFLRNSRVTKYGRPKYKSPFSAFLQKEPFLQEGCLSAEIASHLQKIPRFFFLEFGHSQGEIFTKMSTEMGYFCRKILFLFILYFGRNRFLFPAFLHFCRITKKYLLVDHYKCLTVESEGWTRADRRATSILVLNSSHTK